MTSGFDVNLAPRAPTDHSRNGLATLLGLFRELGVHSDLDTLLRRVETTALQVLDCERLTIFVNEPRANALCSRVATGSHEIRTPADRGIVGATFSEHHIIKVDDAPADPRFYDAIDRQTGFRTRSLLSVPLQGIDQHTIGVLELLNKRDGSFTATDEALALTLGSLTEIALQRQTLSDLYRAKQRLEHDLQLARDIQRSLLPVTFPLVPGLDIVGWTQPVDATGGDFYDCFELPDGRIGLVVAGVLVGILNRTSGLFADPMLRMDALPRRVADVTVGGATVADNAPLTTDSPTDSLSLVAAIRDQLGKDSG